MRYLLLLTSLLSILSCSSDEVNIEEQFEKDIVIIEQYLADNNLTAQKTSNGLYYIIDSEGSLEKPNILSRITVKYSGYFVDGTTFDSSDEFRAFLYDMIEGWQIGIPKFGIQGKGKLIIPSKFAYGDQEIKSRKNAVLVFDIELLDFEN